MNSNHGMSDGEARDLRVFLLHQLDVVEHIADVVVHRVDVGSDAITSAVSHCVKSNE